MRASTDMFFRTLILVSIALASALPARAGVTPTWSQNWLSAPNSNGKLAAATTIGDTQVLVGTRAMDLTAFVSAHNATTGALLWTRSIAAKGETTITALQPRRAGDGFYVAGRRFTGEHTVSFVARFDLDGTMHWVSDLIESHDVEYVQIVDSGDATVVSYLGTEYTYYPRRYERYFLRLNAEDGHFERRETSLETATFETTFVQLVGSPAGDVFMLDGSRLTRFDATHWQGAWSVDLRAAHPDWTLTGVSLAPDGDVLLLGSSGAPPVYRALAVKVAALDGQVRWSAEDPAANGSSVAPHAVADGGAIDVFYSGLNLTRAYRVDLASGAVTWSRQVIAKGCDVAGSDAGVIALSCVLDQNNDADSVVAVTAASGAVAWESPSLEHATPRFVGIGAGRVFFGRNDPQSHLIDGYFVDATNGGNSADLASTLRNPVLGSLVADDDSHSIAVGATLGDAGGVLTVRRYLDATGEVLWEKSEPLGFPTVGFVETPRIALGKDGSVVVTGSARDGNDPKVVGRITVIASYDRATGNKHWSHTAFGSVQRYASFPAPELNALAVAPNGTVYVVRSEGQYDYVYGGVVWTMKLERLSAATGDPVWSKLLATSGNDLDGYQPYMFATTSGLLLQGDAAAPDGFALRGESDGNIVWARPGVAYRYGYPTFAIANDGDVVAAYSAISAPAKFAVEKFGVADGARRWQTQFGAEGDYARALIIASDGSIVASGRSRLSGNNYPFVLKLSPSDGHVIWNSTMAGVAMLGMPATHLRESPEGNFVFNAYTGLPQIRGYERVCALCRSHAVRIDRDTGAMLGWQEIGAITEDGAAGGDELTYFGGFDVTGGLTLHAARADVGSPETLAFEHITWPSFIPGAADVSLTFTGVDEGAVFQFGFSARVTNTGGSALHGLALDVINPAFGTFSNLSCRVDGSGACGARTVYASVRQLVDLEPGATAVVDGDFSYVTGYKTSAGLGVIAELPFEIATASPVQGTQLPVPGPLLQDSFE